MPRKFSIVAVLCAIVLTCGAVLAQTPVVTIPFPVTSGNASGNISVTNTFQSVFSAATAALPRKACAVQNNSAATMFVFFGSISTATSGTSVSLAAGATTNCNIGGVVLQDQVSITGTAGGFFYAAQQ